ncbi:MAG: gliding motility-associated C-terminal domain-containing protein, partial [Chitinophagia bacterium]|nr:gliding motility-associated C-terminal domain-containing protein [Chitinophagia bacterium]
PSMYVSDSTIGNPWVAAITSQHYTVIASDVHGCTDTAAVNVIVYPAGTVYFERDTIVLYPGESIQLSPKTNCSNIAWFPPQGLSDPLVSDPIASPTTSTRYAITGSTPNGCLMTDTIYLDVRTDAVVQVPNAFVPGSTNNLFHIDLRGEAKLNHFRIYNRWGNLVFETTDITKGWDGNYNGTPQPFGVYVYDIEAVAAGRIVSKHGNVTLIR